MKSFYFLHGFLGDRFYFDAFIERLRILNPENRFFSYSLFADSVEPELSPEQGFSQWAINFNDLVKKNGASDNIMVAYSMGGRLGLHSFVQDTELWHSCHCLSANPGLINPDDITARLTWEDQWCQMLDELGWDEFLKKWNQQGVFINSDLSKLNKVELSKPLLKWALKNWSLTRHEFQLEQVNHPKVHWHVGEKDSKYMQIFELLKQDHKYKNIHIVPGKGHRMNSLPMDLFTN